VPERRIASQHGMSAGEKQRLWQAGHDGQIIFRFTEIVSSPQVEKILLYRKCRAVHKSLSPDLGKGTLRIVT